ncbi:ribonuclease HII [Oscillospiraceae bacterium OttesenSCG-928-F05]|nr:ribonuclease HII [Oscillospiraceae bacterium OttesenSCG-928-F05]
MLELYAREQALRDLGFSAICGVDEAGCGPLAGPVCAAAVILPGDVRIEGLNDSKKLSEKKRERIAEVVKTRAIAWAVAFADEAEVDALNICGAATLAMVRAVAALGAAPDRIVGDGLPRETGWTPPVDWIVGGDGKYASIAAASVLAKTARDALMLDYAEQYPGYGFEKHKGYPTKAHYDALFRLGPCAIHRESFLGKYYKQVGR